MPHPDSINVLLEAPTYYFLMTYILKIINIYFVLDILFTEPIYLKF